MPTTTGPLGRPYQADGPPARFWAPDVSIAITATSGLDALVPPSPGQPEGQPLAAYVEYIESAVPASAEISATVRIEQPLSL
jgi:hypothetical protein